MRGRISHHKRLYALAILLVPLGTVGLAPAAEAAIALDIVNAENGTKVGSIVFPAATGASAEDVEFELDTGPRTFAQGNITAISWTLDPATLDVLSLNLDALQGDEVCSIPAHGPCSNATLTLTAQSFETVTTTCTGAFGTCMGAIGIPVEIDFIDPAPAYACVGFEPPLADGPVTARGNRALPLKAELLDEDSVALTDADLGAAPVVQVVYHSGIGGPAEDVSDQALWAGQGSDGNRFVFDGDRWRFNLKVGNYSAPGAYLISIIAGDGDYRVEPTCEAEFVVNP